MTDEEKKSIELLKDFEYRSKTENYNKITLEDVLNVKIILNLIENQQKEIDNLKEIEAEHKKINGELRKEIDELKEQKIKTENKREKFYNILADDFKLYVDRIIVGRSCSYPCGWIYKKDVERLIENIAWREY